MTRSADERRRDDLRRRLILSLPSLVIISGRSSMRRLGLDLGLSPKHLHHLLWQAKAGKQVLASDRLLWVLAHLVRKWGIL